MDFSKITSLFSSDVIATAILGAGVEVLRRILSSFKALGEKQTEFNVSLAKMETKVLAEIDHLKIIAVQHNDRLYGLETRQSLKQSKED